MLDAGPKDGVRFFSVMDWTAGFGTLCSVFMVLTDIVRNINRDTRFFV